MPSEEHVTYQNSVRTIFHQHRDDPNYLDLLKLFANAIFVLLELDLEPARPILQACYAEKCRGTHPRDPIMLFRSLLLAILVGQPGINEWVAQARSSWMLRALTGLGPEEAFPGVGTLYDFMHRLHDGPARWNKDVINPSDLERARSRQARNLKKERKENRKASKKKSSEAATGAVTMALIKELEQNWNNPLPDDLISRMAAILMEVAVKRSFKNGFLGDLRKLIIGGDGSRLPTGASRFGRLPTPEELEEAGFTPLVEPASDEDPGGKGTGKGKKEKKGKPRVYSDPDAQFGWDHHNDAYIFGYHFYEFSVVGTPHDLPLFLRLDPANYSEMLSSLTAFHQMMSVLNTHLPDFPSNFILVQDAGHDSRAHWLLPLNHGVTPIIPLSKKISPDHPTRDDLRLSPNGIPLCPGGAEMKPWGRYHLVCYNGRLTFICPVKGGAIDVCPRAPEGDPNWRCSPNTRLAPTKSITIGENPRITPPIPRGSDRWRRLYAARSGCERSNAMTKLHEKTFLQAGRCQAPPEVLLDHTPVPHGHPAARQGLGGGALEEQGGLRGPRRSGNPAALHSPGGLKPACTCTSSPACDDLQGRQCTTVHQIPHTDPFRSDLRPPYRPSLSSDATSPLSSIPFPIRPHQETADSALW